MDLRYLVLITCVIFPFVTTCSAKNGLKPHPALPPHLPSSNRHNTASDADCLAVLEERKLSWLAVWLGQTGAGTAYYYANGTFVNWDQNGKVINLGNYTITSGPEGWCYEVEHYSAPFEGETCNTFKVISDPKEPDMPFLIGCETFTTQCYETCDEEKYWENWYVARVVLSD